MKSVKGEVLPSTLFFFSVFTGASFNESSKETNPRTNGVLASHCSEATVGINAFRVLEWPETEKKAKNSQQAVAGSPCLSLLLGAPAAACMRVRSLLIK